MDVAKGFKTIPTSDCKAFITPNYERAPGARLATANQLIEVANLPVLFLRIRAVDRDVETVIRGFPSSLPNSRSRDVPRRRRCTKISSSSLLWPLGYSGINQEVASLEILF